MAKLTLAGSLAAINRPARQATADGIQLTDDRLNDGCLGNVLVGRIRTNTDMSVSGQLCWTLFDSGARNSYIVGTTT